MANYTLTETQVTELIDQAVEYGISKMGKTALGIQIASFWLDGYMAACDSLTEDDRKSLTSTMKNYYFT
jgi:hypothetical protein